MNPALGVRSAAAEGSGDWCYLTKGCAYFLKTRMMGGGIVYSIIKFRVWHLYNSTIVLVLESKWGA